MTPAKAPTTRQLAGSSKTESIHQFALQAEWAQWLAAQHDKSGAIWLRHAKKGSPTATLSYAEALEVALCFGWIDGQRNSESEHFYLQRWSPRGPRSIWSKVNRDKALAYMRTGHMQPSGLAEIERAKKDGRWDAAYDPASRSEVPADLEAALKAHPGAAEFFATLSAQN
ncbi:MAG: YdeI/OmpD-associated family protein, partial [Polaromonas sp.]|nr:YdeI/OmpD-associated family protein [Polaromonas sp.]